MKMMMHQYKQTKEEVSVKNCAPFTDCITEINNTEKDDAKDLDAAI